MKPLSCLLYLFVLPGFITNSAFAQKKHPESKTPVEENAILAKISGMKSFPGYFQFYHDEKKDKIFLVIDKFNIEFLYVNSLATGVGSNDIGLDRGQLGGEHVVKFDRRGPKVLMLEPNYMYRAITENTDERRAVEEGFAQSVLWGFPVEAEHENKVLVDATSFFLRDAHGVVKRLREIQQGEYKLEDSRSALFAPGIKNFPKNSEFEATLTFTGDAKGDYIQSVVPSPSSVTVRMHHSMVELPDNGYTKRKFDPRSGFFGISYFDYATPISEPIEKRFIARHRLKKKDPTAPISEAVEPIVYYLDRGTPEPIRSALLDGARWWNQAFESAGYKDAFKVEMMPDGADPMDVRFNVIQWVHRATRGWSYGATVMDPRTGEIIKGHVTLGSLRVRQDFLIAEGLLAPYEGNSIPPQMEQMALARLRQLSAHEVGHTLGIAHAYSSSSEHNASVMDYPHPFAEIQNGKISLQKAYDDKIGSWDKASILFGYQDFAPGTNEDDALCKVIDGALSSGLTFLSDQDARPQGGSHPYAHLWDNGEDAADELQRVMQIRSLALKNFGERNIRPGAPLATLEEVLVPMYFFHRYQVEASAKLIGGLNYRYALRGDNQPITQFVPADIQAKALTRLIETISPAALTLPEQILKSIPPRPMGYDRHRELIEGRNSLTFDALAGPEAASHMTLSLILHPARAGRLVEHHARDEGQPSLESVIDKLLGATFKTPVKSGFEAAVQMTINKVVLSELISLARNGSASSQVRAIAILKLTQLKTWLNQRVQSVPGESWRAHYMYAQEEIRQFTEDPKASDKDKELVPPPGQPIGMADYDFCGQF